MIWMREGDKGPMPLVGWETRRDGVDDYRYLQMLEDSIAANRDNRVARQASRWLESLRKRITTDPHKAGSGKPLALETIGADALDALPAVAALYSHPDGFVRLGATFVLWRMGPSAAAGLQPALVDKFLPVSQVAGDALSDMGSAATPALPALIKMFDMPEKEYHLSALKVIAGIGPDARAAVPGILEVWQGAFPNYPTYTEALAAIGPDAAAAVPMLERFLAQHGDHKVHSVAATVHYALFRIRGERKDLDGLLKLIENRDKVNQNWAADCLIRLGRAARAALPGARRVMEKGKIDEERAKKLEEFIKKAQQAE